MIRSSDRLGLEDHAIYLPALGPNYAIVAHKGKFSRSLPITARQLNFLQTPKPRLGFAGISVPWKRDPLFHYPYALYSAGQAAKTDTDARKDSIVSHRNRARTLVLCDSGGFQIISNGIHFEGVKTTERMLRWMERHGNYSMTLDFPPAGIALGNMTQHRNRLIAEGHDITAMSVANGQSLDFNACLLQTMINNAHFVVGQHDKTRFLNVLQGRNETESLIWYEAVKNYPFENWAFAGSSARNLSILLRRLLDMRRDGLLEKARWVHILGVSTLPLGCLYTTIQQCVRTHDSLELQISYDSASPFIQAGNYNVVSGYTMDCFGWHIHSLNIAECGAIGDQTYLNDFLQPRLPSPIEKIDGKPTHRKRLPVHTQIGARVRVDDALIVGGKGRLSVDTDGLHIITNHNLEAFIEAHKCAQRLYKTGHHLDVTAELLSARGLIEMIFKGHDLHGNPINPYQVIDANEAVLDRFGA